MAGSREPWLLVPWSPCDGPGHLPKCSRCSGPRQSYKPTGAAPPPAPPSRSNPPCPGSATLVRPAGNSDSCLPAQIPYVPQREVLSNRKGHLDQSSSACGASMDIERLTQISETLPESAESEWEVSMLSIEQPDN
ncbi:hypothetical protein EYF80_026388 [Liparis tanakae]|uniref:Uncharacterized protein n=1 Tax=Liparis tanakae TaxID=230148 RepID=A0A4Z2HC91_9TELE|nr:hypothetical protein EYF80_026388 [Liparis tanakae]